jgi:hypothetical protein
LFYLEDEAMKIPESLSLEQQFKLCTLQKQVHQLSLEDLQDCCVELLRQNMVKDNLLRQWMKSH